MIKLRIQRDWRRLGLLGMLLLGVIVPLSALIAARLFLPDWRWANLPLHAAVEAVGGFAALTLAVLFLFLRKHKRDSPHDVWIASGLLAMGILDALHATTLPGNTFVWLPCISTLTGGFLFALVWLPPPVSRSRASSLLPLATFVSVGAFGLLSISFPAALPVMLSQDAYTPLARLITSVGGGLFIASAAYFARHYRAHRGVDAVLLPSLCLLFGMAGLLFGFSTAWSAEYWLWHLLRLTAYLHVLSYIFLVYQQSLFELKILSETLEQRIEERTAQLSQEVAERTLTEEALAESEKRYRHLLESVTDYIFTVRVERGRPVGTSHSPGCIAVTGYTPEDYAADPDLWYRMVHEEDREAVKEQAGLLLSGGEALPLEHRILHRDGRIRWIKNTPVLRHDEAGNVVAYEGLVTDITERKNAEEAIRIYNEELLAANRIVTACTSIRDLQEILGRVLAETMKIVEVEEGSICLLQPDGTLSLTAHQGGRSTIFNRDPHNLKIHDCFYGACAGDLKPVVLADREALQLFGLRGEWDMGIRFHAAFPFVTGRRKCVGVLCLFTATERKPPPRILRLVETISAHVALFIENAVLYEETLQHAATLEKKVTERTLELAEANRKLKEIDRLKSMFIASMSHELRTPLNSVIGFSSILLNEWIGPLNDEQKENLALVLKAGRHLLSLINDVIDVSKIEAGQLETCLEEFDLSGAIDEAIALTGKDVREKGLELEVESLSHPMRTDRRRLLQCILNMVGNALKFTQEGFLRISARTVPGPETPGGEAWRDFVEIAVEDSGIGIKEEDKPKIFQAFVRLESPLAVKASGTGLGLYLTRKLVTEVLKGEITFTSEWERGSRFVMVVPADVERSG